LIILSLVADKHYVTSDIYTTAHTTDNMLHGTCKTLNKLTVYLPRIVQKPYILPHKIAEQITRYFPSNVTIIHILSPHLMSYTDIYRGADKSLVRPGRKQADVSVRMA